MSHKKSCWQNVCMIVPKCFAPQIFRSWFISLFNVVLSCPLIKRFSEVRQRQEQLISWFKFWICLFCSVNNLLVIWHLSQQKGYIYCSMYCNWSGISLFGLADLSGKHELPRVAYCKWSHQTFYHWGCRNLSNLWKRGENVICMISNIRTNYE